MSIPLNIDTPSGVEFTVNKTITVDVSGRIRMIVTADKIKIEQKGEQIVITHIDAKRDIKMVVPFYEAEECAYKILGMVAKARKQQEK